MIQKPLNVPHISKEMLDALDALFPERTPEINMDMKEIYFRIGQSPPPAPKDPEIPTPQITNITQAAPMEAGYSDARGESENMMNRRRRVGSSVLRIPIVGGV
jgi:hypothetical protein